MKTLKEIEEIVNNINFCNWIFYIGSKNDVPYLQVQFIAANNDTGIVELQKCRKWQLSYYMTTSEIIRTAFKAVLAAVEHEAAENFLYKNVRIFNPHVDVEALVEIAQSDKIDVRT